MSKAIFYHAGCPVCIEVEQEIINLITSTEVDIVHLGNQSSKISEAEAKGVNSVPALVTPTGNVLHINYGASLQDLKN